MRVRAQSIPNFWIQQPSQFVIGDVIAAVLTMKMAVRLMLLPMIIRWAKIAWQWLRP